MIIPTPHTSPPTQHYPPPPLLYLCQVFAWSQNYSLFFQPFLENHEPVVNLPGLLHLDPDHAPGLDPGPGDHAPGLDPGPGDHAPGLDPGPSPGLLQLWTLSAAAKGRTDWLDHFLIPSPLTFDTTVQNNKELVPFSPN